MTYRYHVGTRGEVSSDLRRFTEIADSTLRDPRGWALGGRIMFRQVRSDQRHDFRLLLAEPREVDAASPVCSARYSCRVGDDVYINERRWREGADTYADRPLIDYRRYVILHEVGHWLSLGHRACPEQGAPAPVMQQQSISLEGCTSQVWPLRTERTEVRRRHL